MDFSSVQTQFFRYIKGSNFTKGCVMALAMIIPITLAKQLEALPIGIGLAVGVLLCSPSDVPGNFRHRFFGMLTATGLAFLATLIGGYSATNVYIQIPAVLIFVFFTSYISVYGFRASLISFSGLLAIVLSFAHLGAESVWFHGLLILFGGVWYILISTLFFLFRRRKHNQLLLGESARMTSDFLVLRRRLIRETKNRKQLQEQQFNLQTTINENHESIREALLSSRKHFGASNSSKRKLLIFIDLVDILELALAQPFNYNRIDKFRRDYPELITQYEKLILLMSEQLLHISEVLIDGKKLILNEKIPIEIKAIEKKTQQAFDGKNHSTDQSGLLLMRNVLDFEKRQAKKILSIERILGHIVKNNKLMVKHKRIRRFLTPVDYSFKILTDNFSTNAPIFRHAARLVVLMFFGILLGRFLDIQNAYWILITIIVIMRPSYGLTKERFKKRTIGTLIGGGIALLLVLITQNPVVYAILAIFCLIAAFSMIQKNYAWGATFITIMVVLSYGLLKPDSLGVIQYRVMDTAIGAVLAILGNLFLWPSWEYRESKSTVIEMLEANHDFLQEIASFYQKKGKLPSTYKLKRKQAFLTMGNLSAAFQRMAQEPKSKQKEYQQFYDYTVLNHTFLASLASLGTFIRAHHTTEASVFFKSYIEVIVNDIQATINQLKSKNSLPESDQKDFLEAADTFLEQEIKELDQQREEELEAGQRFISTELRRQMQEIQLISEQLKWLHQVSLNLKNVHRKALHS